MQFVPRHVNLNNFNYILLFYIHNELSSLARSINWLTILHQIKSPFEGLGSGSLTGLGSGSLTNFHSRLPLTLTCSALQSDEWHRVSCLFTPTQTAPSFGCPFCLSMSQRWLFFLKIQPKNHLSAIDLPQIYLQHQCCPSLWGYYNIYIALLQWKASVSPVTCSSVDIKLLELGEETCQQNKLFSSIFASQISAIKICLHPCKSYLGV